MLKIDWMSEISIYIYGLGRVLPGDQTKQIFLVRRLWNAR